VRVLYVASDQVVPGRTGGSVHVLEVARGLRARGHELEVVIHAEPGRPVEQTFDDVRWRRISWSPPSRYCRFRARPQIAALIRERRPDVVMERYYNFGGEGVLAAAEAGVPSLLEVNAPAIDHPGSWKARLDAALLVRPMRRYREQLCRSAAALVAPLVEIVPAAVRAKTERVAWGANVELFHPSRRNAALRAEWGIPHGALAIVFSSSFRPWHGAHVLRAAAQALSADARFFFVLVGGEGRGAGQGFRGLELGSLAYERMPELLASCDIGVAPYDTRRLGQLELGFFWSPLKIFEYMACGLPIVTLARSPLDDLVRPDRESVSMRDGDAASLVSALQRLAEDPALRMRLGASARARVVEHYSWARHCEQLERVLLGIAA